MADLGEAEVKVADGCAMYICCSRGRPLGETSGMAAVKGVGNILVFGMMVGYLEFVTILSGFSDATGKAIATGKRAI